MNYNITRCGGYWLLTHGKTLQKIDWRLGFLMDKIYYTLTESSDFMNFIDNTLASHIGYENYYFSLYYGFYLYHTLAIIYQEIGFITDDSGFEIFTTNIRYFFF